MHILVIPSAYPTRENALSSIFFKEQSVALSELDNRVGVIFSETRNLANISINKLKENHFQIEKTIESGLVTYRKHGWNIYTMRGALGVNLWINQTVKLFEKYVENEGVPDIIHAHNGLLAGIAAVRIKRKYDIPIVITEHSSSVLKKLIRNHEKPLLKEAYKEADKIVSVSNTLKDAMGNFTDKSIEIIPNIVDTSKFKISNEKKEECFTFLAIGNLKNSKGIIDLVETFAIAFKNKKHVKLKIIGEGEEREKILNTISLLGLGKQVSLEGAVCRENIIKYLAKANAFVLPSKYETFGIAYIEALACGLPIIVTKCGGPEDFFKEGLGYMIPVDDNEKLKEAMNDMVDNIDKFDKEELSRYVREKFSKEIIVKDIQQLYTEVVGGKAHGGINE